MVRLFVAALGMWFVLGPATVVAQANISGKKKVTRPDSPEILLEEFDLDARNVVIAAAKVKTTIQETPGIITVITSKEIEQKGYRTLNEVLRHVPGFHGDRWEGFGWFRESFARGVPRGLLILMNGVNIVEPVRNMLVMDRKIPLEMIHRIEVTSGPGGVLWGSNALLGIVNIITKDGETGKGIWAMAGYGTGLSEINAFKVSASYGNTFLNKLIKLYVNASFFSSGGDKLKTDVTKVFGALPSPGNAGVSRFLPFSSDPRYLKRSYWFNAFVKLDVWKFSFELNFPWERERLLLSPGGSHMTLNYATLSDLKNGLDSVITKSQDQVRWASIKYKDRYLDNKVGMNVNVFYADWQIRLTPFGVYAMGARQASGIISWIDIERLYRVGTTVDMDFQLPANIRLLVGGEVFFEELYRANTRGYDPQTTPTTTSCNPPYSYLPNVDPNRPCMALQRMANDSRRLIGAVFLVANWKPLDQLVLNLGVRGQFSNTYDATVLFSGGLVWNIWRKLYVKINYSEGFRPPDFQSTDINPNVVNQVTFLPNPDLEVESSRSVSSEFNAVLLQNVGVIRRFSLRASYAWTNMNNVITRKAGVFTNSGEREIHSIEMMMRMVFKGNHEWWLGYYFVMGHDSESGDMRQIPNHIIYAGFRANLYKQYIELVATLVLRGGMEDLNYTGEQLTEPGATTPYTKQTVGGAEVVDAKPDDQVVSKIKMAAFLNVGIRVKNIWKNHLEFSVFVYNAVNQNNLDADFFGDSRTYTRSQPTPRITFFFKTVFRY